MRLVAPDNLSGATSRTGKIHQMRQSRTCNLGFCINPTLLHFVFPTSPTVFFKKRALFSASLSHEPLRPQLRLSTGISLSLSLGLEPLRPLSLSLSLSSSLSASLLESPAHSHSPALSLPHSHSLRQVIVSSSGRASDRRSASTASASLPRQPFCLDACSASASLQSR